MYFNIKWYFTIPIRINACDEKFIKKYVRMKYSIDLSLNMLDYHNKILRPWMLLSLKRWKAFDYLYYITYVGNLYAKFLWYKIKISEKPKKYVYNKVDEEKLEIIFSRYSNSEGLIVCNFENMSLRSCIDDKISFKNYIQKISYLAKRNNLKFVINSVYNDEDPYKDDTILVTRLNFQEIIYLAEHKKIKLFISERNWLNDVFKVFYEEINQIIIYPDYYWVNVSKKLFKIKLKEQYDIKNIYSLKWGNVEEIIRAEYFWNIERLVMNNFT